jgi:hypothetical protein
MAKAASNKKTLFTIKFDLNLRKRKHQIACCGELTFEEVTGLF